MKLLLVTKGFPPRIGGVETLCRQVAQGMAERGADVTVVTFAAARPATGELPYRVIELPSRGDVFEWSWQLVPTLRRQRFDVCHVHNLHASVAAAVWAARVRPYVLTAHYHGDGHSRAARLAHPGYRMLARRVVCGAASLTAVSAAEAQLLRRGFGVDAEIIPNGVTSVDDTRPAPDRDPRRIAVVSRLVYYKRVDAVIRALPSLPGYVLHILGDGPEREALLRLAGELGVVDRIRLNACRVSDAQVHRVLGDAGVYVNLSQAESFSYTVLESLAAGTPVVANGSPALAEWARRFPDAVLCADPAYPEQVAAAIRRLSGTRVDVDLGEYALPRVLDRYQRIYARVAG